MNTVAGELAADAFIHALGVGHGEKAAPDAGLVCHDEKFEAGIRQFFQRRACAGENFHVFGSVQIIFFHDERAIAVEKNGSVHSGKLWCGYGKNGIEFFAGLAHPAAFSFSTTTKQIFT
jgi:hypothetical protein